MSFDADYILFIENAATQLNRYFSIFIFLFGTTGNILNILVLSQRAFRLNPCALLFLVSSIANLIALLSGLTSRMLSGWAADLTNTDRCICKLRTFILNVARPVAFWLIALAAIDRWLVSSSSVRRRQMTTLKNAKRSMIIVFILSAVLFSHIIYCYEPNLKDAPLKCYGKTITCRLATDLSFTFVSIFFPISLMFIFGIMTINNIRQSRAQVHTQVPFAVASHGISVIGQRQYSNKVNLHLLLMLFAQVLLLVIFGLPLGVDKLYTTIATNRPTTRVQIAINNFVYTIALHLNFLANGMPFYIYTLTGGNSFRKATVKIILSVKQKFASLTRILHF